MKQPHIVVVTGASGVGKTTLVQALQLRALPGVRCYYFDSLGVPSPERMAADFGSGPGWQEAMTRRWIERLTRNDDGARVAVLDGQIRISMVRAVMAAQGAHGHVVLIDCTHEIREARLRTERGQPELASRDMTAWAAYLRGQADALHLPVLDTSALSVSEATDALERLVPTVGDEASQFQPSRQSR
jgi:dephospho-CoA kinase